jgi:hypothetical protein
MYLNLNIKNQFIFRITLFLAITTHIVTKFQFSDTVYLYPLDIWMIFFPIIALSNYRLYYFLGIQRILFYFGLVLLFFTLSSNFIIYEIESIMRAYKFMIYIPLLMIGFIYNKKLLIPFLYIGMSSMIINLLHYVFVLFPVYGFDIWTPEALASGLSNRYLNFSYLELLF